ncbi:Uma2 family endonuclease [Nocardia miyunensis]|uniref:Uma2 family endonuclease n=1 Tax=Nocardia miyunensis TaxID=282684 RepID=UPI0014718340|nr:Uma2 family endonuclease [Nocardia miyunensis]
MHNELVELAAEMEVPEGFRADAKGEVIVVSPQRSEHWRIISDIDFRIRLNAPSLRTTSDVKIPGTGERAKAPDVGIFHRNAELHASKALAFVEVVADSSRETDYVDKTSIYATGGVPVYLIVDPDRELWTLHTTPTENRYRNTTTNPINVPIEIAGVSVELNN